MTPKIANPRRTSKREPQLRTVGDFADPPPMKSDAADAYATIAARLGEDRSTLETTAWTPERESILDLLYDELDRVPTGILIAWIPVISGHARKATDEVPKRIDLPTGCRLVGCDERLERRTANDK